MMEALNGWTPEKLYELKYKVDTTYEKLVEIEGHMDKRLGRIENTLKQHESEETQSLREQVRELQQRPRIHMQAVVIPFLCACIPAVVILVTHGS